MKTITLTRCYTSKGDFIYTDSLTFTETLTYNDVTTLIKLGYKVTIK